MRPAKIALATRTDAFNGGARSERARDRRPDVGGRSRRRTHRLFLLRLLVDTVSPLAPRVLNRREVPGRNKRGTRGATPRK